MSDIKRQPAETPLRNNPTTEGSIISSLDTAVSPTSLTKPDKKGSSVAGKQEETRSELAKSLVNMMQYTIIGIFIIILIDLGLVAFDKKEDNQTPRELITLILTANASLIGSAIGYYFGNQESKNKN